MQPQVDSTLLVLAVGREFFEGQAAHGGFGVRASPDPCGPILGESGVAAPPAQAGVWPRCHPAQAGWKGPAAPAPGARAEI